MIAERLVYANLNAYTSFFNNVRWPVIGNDAYATIRPADRFVCRSALDWNPSHKWERCTEGGEAPGWRGARSVDVAVPLEIALQCHGRGG